MTEIVANEPRGQLFIYQSNDGKDQIECRFEEENLWLSLTRMSTLLGSDKPVI